MFGRWFVGAYSVAVITGFTTAPWAFPDSAFVIIGLYFIPFALPFVLVGSLVGWGMQWAVERLMPPGWERTAILACMASAAGGVGMHLITRTPLYVIIAACAAVTGAVLSQHQTAWRRGWLVVALAAGVATALVMSI